MKLLSDALRRELALRPERVKNIADKLISLAEDGDLTAMNMIFDRIEGKPLQTLEIDQTVTQLTPEQRFARLLELQAKVIHSLPHATPSQEEGVGQDVVFPVKQNQTSDKKTDKTSAASLSLPVGAGSLPVGAGVADAGTKAPH